MPYDKDREFEAACMPYFIDALKTHVFPHSEFHTESEKYDNKALDQGVSLDIFVTRKEFPTQTIQVKSRRGKNYKFFKHEKDFPLSIEKFATNDRYYPGDYYKCQANMWMYGFGNADNPEYLTSLLYWVLIDYNKLRDKFFEVGGYKNIPGVKIQPHEERNILSYFMIIPWSFITPCIMASSEKLDMVTF